MLLTHVARNLKIDKMLQRSFAKENRPKYTFFKYLRNLLQQFDCCKANVARILENSCNILFSNVATKKTCGWQTGF